MKKFFLFLATFGMVAAVAAQSDEVTIKRGKAVMSEAYYYQLKQKADAYERLNVQVEETQKKLDAANDELKKKQTKPIRTFNDSASYAIARDIATNWQQQQLGIDIEIVAQSLLDLAHGVNNWNQKVTQSLLHRFQQQFDERQRKKQEDMMASLDENKKAGEKFLKENARNKSVYTTPSGLQYKIVTQGKGPKPKPENVVKVHYTGTLIDGKKFDSSVDRGEPIEFPVGQVIPGWIEGLQLMPVGSKYIFYIPSNLAYGDRPTGDIPPGSTLIFEVELLDIVK